MLERRDNNKLRIVKGTITNIDTHTDADGTTVWYQVKKQRGDTEEKRNWYRQTYIFRHKYEAEHAIE